MIETKKLKTLDQQHLRLYARKERMWLEDFSSGCNLKMVIERSALIIAPNNEKHPHQ